MSWRIDEVATETAKRVFPQCQDLVATRDGAQYLLQPTPYGPVELLRVREGYLVAARNPPGFPEPENQVGSLDPRILHHLAENDLIPWRVIPTADFSEAVRTLAGADATEDRTGPQPPPAFSHYVAPLPVRPELVGEDRLRVCEQLAALAEVQCEEAPLVQLTGPDGVGKRTVISALRASGYRIRGELPLSRLRLPRVFSTMPELVVETLLVAEQAMQTNDLLVVSDAELIGKFRGPTTELIVRELRRLPHVVLTNRSLVPWQHPWLVSLDVPGLRVAEARNLLESVHPEVKFAGKAMSLLIDAARTDNGVIPGRMFYLLDLARSLTKQPAGVNPRLQATFETEFFGISKASQELVLAPDEVAAATSLVRSTRTNQ